MTFRGIGSRYGVNALPNIEHVTFLEKIRNWKVEKSLNSSTMQLNMQQVILLLPPDPTTPCSSKKINLAASPIHEMLHNIH